MKAKANLLRPSTKGDLDEMAGHIITAISKALEDYATKDDLKNLATKEDLKKLDTKVGQLDTKVGQLDTKVDKLSYDVSDIRRRVIDLEVETKLPPHNPSVASSLSI